MSAHEDGPFTKALQRSMAQRRFTRTRRTERHPDILADAGGIQSLAELRGKLSKPQAKPARQPADIEYGQLLEFVNMLQAVEAGERDDLYFKVHGLGEHEIAVTVAGAESVLHVAAVLFLKYFRGESEC